MKVKLLFQILFIQIFTKIILSKELLVKEEFQKPTITSSDVVGWSQNIIRTCEQKNIVEYTGQIFGVFSQDVTLNKKTYDKLAPHWSALVRLDLMLYGSVDSDEGDYAGISIDSNPIDRYTKYDSEGYKICSDSKGFWGTPYNDAIYPYQKNVTHTSDQLSIIINSKFTGTNKDSDYEGYAFKHVSVYIDTCYDSCQKCTGPSANQCTECIKNAVNVNGICTCSGSYFTYNFVCVLSCPNGFVGNPDTRICEQSKCLNNCSMCANQVCTQCNSSFKLINGECLAQCPSYSVDKGTFCEDKITGMKYGGYIFKGLYSANFGDSEIQGQGLKLVNFKNGGATFSSCSGERFVGGWNVAGSGSEIRRELPNFKPHWSIRIGFKYIMIDNWSNSESIQVILDNSNIIDKITRSSGTQAGNICGNSNTEVKGVYDKNMTHISSSLIITISNTLASSKSPFEASFGIREFFILVNYCQENCLECNNMGCTKCPQGTFLYQLNCEITCPTQLGFWANSNTNTCDICQGNCLQCDISATSCLKCKPGTYLSNKSCSSTCPDGFAPNQDTLTCDKCHQNCKTCSIYNDETKCTSCQGNRFLSGTQCLEKCPDGTYGEFNGNICAACNVNCLTCSGKTNANCLSCNIGKLYQPDDKTCGSTCKTTQYISINNCTACHTTCLTCSGGTDKDCLTCSSVSNRYFYQNQCLSQCPDQFYGDKNAQSCKKCDSTCFNCTGSNQDQCTQCSGYLYLNSGNKCLNTCPSGQFKNQANNKCEACDSNCLTCSQAKNMCTSCSSTMFLDTDGVCKNQCPDGKWTNQYNVQQKATKKCELCDSSCKTCGSTSKITCTSCNSPLFLDKAISQCVSTCPSKFYGNQSSWTCDKCESTCQECDGPNSNQCKQCSGNLYLDDNKCVTNCQGGKFSNQSTNNCDLCDKTQCKECISSNTNCTKCNTNLYLYNNTCQSSCPKGYFSNTSTGLCEKCNTSCETCYGSGADQCSNCNGNLFFEPVTKQCKPSCQQKYYPNSDNNQCMQCDQSCLECSGPLQDQCTACLNTLILFNNQCISKCPDQYFKDPNAQNCLSCDIRCFNCTDNSSKSCTACKGDLFLTSNKECLNVCPDGTYKESLDNNCQKCDQSCLTCSGPDKINCLKCTGQLFYEDNQCKQECYSGWKNSQNNKCDECNPQCSKCDGPNQNNCLECPNGTFLNPLEKTCVTECPVNYYSDSSNNKCEKCDQSCKNCLGSGQDKCTECEGQLFLKDGKFCSSSCNGSEYGNKLNNKCESCKSTCQNCEDQDDKCTSCNIGTFLINNKCEQNCPDSTFKNNNSNTCDICNQSCLTCSGPSDIECNSCKTGTFLDKSKKSCVSECPIQYFGDSITETCQKCVENCNQCSNDQKCSKCSSGFFLHEGQCISNCPTKYFNDSSTQNCTQCSQNCQTCFDSTVNGCLTCIPGTFKNVDNSSCLQENECPSNKYPDKDTQKCESCFSTCAECTGKDESQCKKCITDRFLYKGECLNDCPNNTFKQGTKCIDCHSSCSSCSGSSEFQCLSCLSGYLQEGTCLNECIQNYYPSLKNGQQVCLQCHEQCQKCSGPDSNNCTECPQNSFLYQNDCMKDCPVQYFGDSQANKCLKCIENCDQCSDNEKCLKCSSGFFLHNSQCLSNCPTKYFNDQNTQNCTQCSQNCQTCFDSTINGCLTCIPVTYKNVDNSSCVQENGCPSNKYPDKDTQKCESCFSTCFL